jgi:outer membrane protein TolC
VKPRSSRFIFHLACMLPALLGGACARYVPQPLDDNAVERALRPEADDHLRAAARELRHPILQPLDVDLSRGLTPDGAAVLAVLVNPELRAERARRALADAQLLQAGLLPNPQLTAGPEFPFANDPADSFTGYSAGLSWDVTSLLTHRSHVDAARFGAQSVLLDVAWKEWQVAEAAKTAAYDVIALVAQLAEERRADQQFSENLEAVRRAVERHDKTLLELSAAEASFQDARAAVLATEKDLAHARQALNRSLGLPTDAVMQLHEVELPSHLEPPLLETLTNGLNDRRLDLVALRRGYDSQDATLRAAILAQFPRINFGVTVARDTSRVDTVGLGATIDIPIFDRNQGVIATEAATRQKLFDEYVLRVFTARSELATALADLRATNRQIDAAEAALPSFQTLAGSYHAALGRGNADILSAYAAQTALIQRRIDLAKLKQQLVQDWVTLEIASGQYLPMSQAATAPTTMPSSTEGL